MTSERQERLFKTDEEIHETAAQLTSALLARLPIPADRDQAADYAVSLFWQVERGLLSESPEQARPHQEEFRFREKQQP